MLPYLRRASSGCSTTCGAPCRRPPRRSPRTATSTSTNCSSATTSRSSTSTTCLAAPALDLATYAADVVRGRDGDLVAVDAVLDCLLTGYGERPEALGWHLSAAILGRVAHPFHRQVPAWPDRVDAMLRAAEDARG